MPALSSCASNFALSAFFFSFAAIRFGSMPLEKSAGLTLPPFLAAIVTAELRADTEATWPGATNALAETSARKRAISRNM
eukprot:CAMPEP_0119055870 /NCGR_PEP_ID=MMETSP1178-20130426/553_1 /TAXON_ID=33656 /ORGANISM="unid sp, Strain CCMP2000" /LENGTH=79 /DNA_ID=CAMNT_0007036523 /DNA_START=219 /DNA_END=458 /DNA_ORIENTATION=+